jgi:hypothetical protein
MIGKKLRARDAYDNDSNTASVEDDAENINGGDPVRSVLGLPSVGMSKMTEADFIEEEKRKLKEIKDSEDSNYLPGPAADTANDIEQRRLAKIGAFEGFSGLLPRK